MKDVKGIFGFKETRKQEFINPSRQSIEQTEDYSTKKDIQTIGLTSKDIQVDTITFSDATTMNTASSGGGHVIQEEGVDLTQRSNLNFIGSLVTASDDAGNDATKITITSPDLSGYVPYTGATTDVDLGTNNLIVDTNTLFVDTTNKKVGVGATTFGGGDKFLVTTEAANGISLKYHVNGTTGGNWRTYKSRGTAATPLRTKSGDVLTGFNGFGYYAANDVTTATAASGANAQFQFSASQDHTSTTMGTAFNLRVTPNGSTSLSTRLTILNNGYVGLTATTPTTDLSVQEKSGMNAIGGFMVKLTNKTGSNSVKGTVVYVDPSVDDAFEVNPIDGDMPIGVVFEDGIADGSECWVTVSGIAEVLLVNSVATTRSYVAYSSATTAGRIDTASSVPAALQHFREIGHTLASASAGTNVLVKCVLHFN